MSRFHEAPCPVVARRIADNLERLAAHPFCGDALRAMCGTLRASWAARCLRAQLGLERPSIGAAAGGTDAAHGADAAPGATPPAGPALH
jgi:hypothetical protein